jgi:predicted PurR-regulated permease PerM
MQNPPPEPSSPAWQPGTRLAVGALLLVLALIVLSRLRQLLVPSLLALLLAYVLHPVVTRLAHKLRLSRGLAVLIVYLMILVIMAGATTGMGLMVSQQVAGLVADLGQISASIPGLLERLAHSRFTIGPWTFDLAAVNLAPVLDWLTSSVRPLLTQTGVMVASAAGATASAVGLILAVMVFGYYMLVDFGTLDDSLIEMVPGPYRADVRRLLDETGAVWHAFLRGQLILGLVVGSVVAVVMTVLGVRFSLVLGLIAGALEFVPIFGPLIAGLIAVLVALFQGANWWGLSPLWFGLVVLAAFALIQQVENNVLVPRIIGSSLNLNPLFVLLGALAGGVLAGVLGLLLAAPTLATLRLWIGYIYRKVVGLETWPASVLKPPRRSDRPPMWIRLGKRWRRAKPRPAKPEEETR